MLQSKFGTKILSVFDVLNLISFWCIKFLSVLDVLKAWIRREVKRERVMWLFEVITDLLSVYIIKKDIRNVGVVWACNINCNVWHDIIQIDSICQETAGTDSALRSGGGRMAKFFCWQGVAEKAYLLTAGGRLLFLYISKGISWI